jgi:hypothetical protein
MYRAGLVGGLTFASCFVASLAAQAHPIELGQDVGVALSVNGTTVRTVSVPTGSIRVGVFVSPLISVEPEVSLTHVGAESGGSLTTLSLAVSLPVHLVRDPERVRPYVRPLVGIVAIDANGSATQVQAGVGLGLKSPLAERLGARLEVAIVRGFESEDLAGVTQIGLRVGFSFFTR